MVTLFRSLILVSNAVYVLWFFQPYNAPWLYETEILNALSWSGWGGNELLAEKISGLLIIAWLATAFGLWFFKAWARTTFVVLNISTVILTPIFGLLVQSSVDVILTQVMTIADGMLLFMCYFSSVSANFNTKNSPS
ncbi:MAG: hypothetical protein L3J28_10840 [Candidatus Polarisedimenticolaceae bacterium]|nr:hypothetical protein [Candidatus Polarisedimenticolaceae bacterium]